MSKVDVEHILHRIPAEWKIETNLCCRLNNMAYKGPHQILCLDLSVSSFVKMWIFQVELVTSLLAGSQYQNDHKRGHSFTLAPFWRSNNDTHTSSLPVQLLQSVKKFYIGFIRTQRASISVRKIGQPRTGKTSKTGCLLSSLRVKSSSL